MAEFGSFNFAVLLLYMVLTLVLGALLSKKVETASDFYVGRKTTPWWAIGLSVLATYVSAMTFLGAPAWSYSTVLSVIAIHMNYPIVVVIVMSFFLPFFFNSDVASIYEYQEKRFGPTSRIIMSIVFFISQAMSSAAILYGTALVIAYITGISVVYCIIIVTLVALLYTVMGGITAVIWTDVLQALMLLGGGIIVIYQLMHKMPIPLSETLSELKSAGKMNAIDWSADLTKSTTIWAGVIAMSLYHTTVYGANQMMVQRTLAAKNIGDAKKSFLLMGFAAFFIYFLFILMGTLFYSYYGGKSFDNANTIILEFIDELKIPGLMGLIVASVMAASMSSLDSAFNSLATCTTVDFYERYFKKGQSPQHYLKATRYFTIIWAVLIIIPALMYTKSTGSILEILSKVGSYFVGARLSMYGLGFFSKHTTEKGLLVGVAAGMVVLILVSTYTSIAWPWYAVIGAAVNIAVLLPMSLALDGRQQAWSPYSIKGQQLLFKEQGKVETDNGWFVVPGKLEKYSYYLLAFFVITFVFLLVFQSLV